MPSPSSSFLSALCSLCSLWFLFLLFRSLFPIDRAAEGPLESAPDASRVRVLRAPAPTRLPLRRPERPRPRRLPLGRLLHRLLPPPADLGRRRPPRPPPPRQHRRGGTRLPSPGARPRAAPRPPALQLLRHVRGLPRRGRR